MGNRLRTFPKLENVSLILNQGIGVCVLKRKSKFSIFASIYTLPFPDSGSEKRCKCAQSIPRIKFDSLSLLRESFFLNFGSKKHEKIAQIPVYFYTPCTITNFV